MPINISNAKRRDAVVSMEGVFPRRALQYLDEHRRPVHTRRLLKTDVAHDLPALMKKRKTPAALATALVKQDPDIDIEEFGMFLTDTSRVYVSKKGIVHLVEEYELLYNPDGTLREKRPLKKEPQNINTDVPLKWTGKFIRKKEAIRRFVFTNKKQLMHVNGLTFDFLFDMARTLDKKDSLLLIRGGEKGDQPIIMNRGGRAYNAFLEGRVKGESYCLILHLSNMELKRPKEVSVDAEE
jgi:hypothetical protein